jgi:hypothetical protein
MVFQHLGKQPRGSVVRTPFCFIGWQISCEAFHEAADLLGLFRKLLSLLLLKPCAKMPRGKAVVSIVGLDGLKNICRDISRVSQRERPCKGLDCQNRVSCWRDSFEAESPISGTSTNPACSLGPAVISGHWQGGWIYWVGPVVGSVVACVACSALAKRITVAKLYHFDSDHDRLFRKAHRPSA